MRWQRWRYYLYLPGKFFWRKFSEQHIGAEYLKDKRCKAKIISFELNKKIIDTFETLIILKVI